MKCIVCDRCKTIIENPRRCRVITCARPLKPRTVCDKGGKVPYRGNDPQQNDLLWEKEICDKCLDELEARVAAHLRRERRRNSPSAVRFFGECAVDYSARTVTIHGEPVVLSRREFDILELLSLNAGQVFDRERVYESVWGIDGEGSSDTVMEHIRKIRSKLARHTLHSYIETVWGCGYKWNG